MLILDIKLEAILGFHLFKNEKERKEDFSDQTTDAMFSIFLTKHSGKNILEFMKSTHKNEY